MADDRFGLAVPQAERCLADSVADDLGLGDSHPDDWAAVCPAHSGSHLDGLVPVDRALAGWRQADSAADDLALDDSHPDDWAAVCPANCGSHPVG